MKQKIGTIIVPPGVLIEKHEKLTVDFLAINLKIDITFLVPSRQPDRKTPDITMDNKSWEIKSPKGRSPRTIENNLRLAIQQSQNIIIDLRRMDGRIPTHRYTTEIERQFLLAKSVRRIIIITREEKIIDLKR